MGRTWLPNVPLKVTLGVAGVDELVSHLLGGDGVAVVLLWDGDPVKEDGTRPLKSRRLVVRRGGLFAARLTSNRGRLPRRLGGLCLP